MESVHPARTATAARSRAAEALPRRLSDERLARAAARGDERAFAAIYERYGTPLHAYCRSIVRHEQDALDVLQATLTAAWTALRQGRRTAPLRPWLYRIAHNESISQLRRRARQPLADPGQIEMAMTSPSAEEDADRRAQWESLLRDLAALTEQTRTALVLRECSGLSHEEIAVVLGTSAGAAKQSILEARRGLAEMAEGHAMSCERVQAQLSDGDGRVLRGRRVSAHLRDCSGCAAFAAAIGTRKRVFGAYAAPALPFAAETLLARVLHAGAHGGGGSSTSGIGALAAGKTAGALAGWKTAGVVAAMVAGASAGGVAVHRALTPSPSHAPASAPATLARAHHGAAQRAAAHPVAADHGAAHHAAAQARSVDALPAVRVIAAGHGERGHHSHTTRHPAAPAGAAQPSHHSSTVPAHSTTVAASAPTTTHAALGSTTHQHPAAGAGHRATPGHGRKAVAAHKPAATPPRRRVRHRHTAHHQPARRHHPKDEAVTTTAQHGHPPTTSPSTTRPGGENGAGSGSPPATSTVAGAGNKGSK